MEQLKFDKLLLKTAFSCMASDGEIDDREVAIIKSMCEKSELFENFNFEQEINQLVSEINENGQAFILSYFDLLEKVELSEQEELTVIDFAVKTIYADEIVDYSEIKFFKNIRHRLKLSDESILKEFPDIEDWLEDDIVTESYLDKITAQFLSATELPQFELINIDKGMKNN